MGKRLILITGDTDHVGSHVIEMLVVDANNWGVFLGIISTSLRI